VADDAPPGQLNVYVPGSRLSVKVPERPVTRFSFSPRIRAPSSTSISLTRPVPALVTLKVVRPASTSTSAGSQPASVSLTATSRAPPAVDEPGPPDPHASSTSAATTSSVAAPAVRAARRPWPGSRRPAGHSTYSAAGTR
jgi:hypothetical protein